MLDEKISRQRFQVVKLSKVTLKLIKSLEEKEEDWISSGMEVLTLGKHVTFILNGIIQLISS